jgi:cytohesin
MRRAAVLVSFSLLASLVACGTTARDQLDRMGIPFSVTSLLAAAEAGDQHVVGLFLEAGMTPNGTDGSRRSVLAAASAGGDPEVVRALLAAQADPNVADDQARTPLMAAALAGHAEAVRLLLDAGADPGAVRSDGMTVLMQAAAAGHADVLDILLERGLEVDQTDPFGNTALLHAVEGGHAEAVLLLLQHGADPDRRTRTTGAFAIGLAAAHGDVESTRHLIAAGADLERRDLQQHMSSLAAASLKGHADVVQLLLEAGADPATRDGEGNTPLMAAANGGHVAVMEQLLAHGADPDTRGGRGVTALMFAALTGQAEAVDVLLEGGADPTLETEGRYSAVRAARQEGHDRIAATLEDAIERRSTGIPGARRWARFARYGDAYRTPLGWTAVDPLTTEARFGEVFSILGIDPAEGPRTRRALLLDAASESQILLVRGPRSEWMSRLLERGAPLDAEPALVFSDRKLRSADGLVVDTLEIERAGDAVHPPRRHLLGVVDLGSEVVVVDAGGPANAFDATLVERFLTSLRIEPAVPETPSAPLPSRASAPSPAAPALDR